MNENKIELRFFPKNDDEALAFAYIQQQSLSDKTPKEVMRLYDAALSEISEEHKAIRKEKAQRHSSKL